MSRYHVEQTVPVIGFYSVHEDNGFQQYASLQTIIINIILHDLKIEDVRFRIFPVFIKEEHRVPVEWQSESKATGFTGVIENNDLNSLTIANQYPTASYGQTSTCGDTFWRIIPGDNGWELPAQGLNFFRSRELPWMYTELTKIMDELWEIAHGQTDMKVAANNLLQRIVQNIEVSHKNWHVEQEEHSMEDFHWKQFKITVE